MTVEDKLVAMSTELAKQTISGFFPPASIILNAIEAEINRVKQENMKQMIDKAFDELGELKDLWYKEMNAKENQMIHQIMQNVGDEFEFNKRDAYAYVLVNVMKQKYDKKLIYDVIFQLQNLSSYDLIEFKRLYERNLDFQSEIQPFSIYDIAESYGHDKNFVDQAFQQAGFNLENFIISGKDFNYNDLPRTTLNKLEYVGIVNIPNYVNGSGDLSSFYKPSLTFESRYLYEIALTPPE